MADPVRFEVLEHLVDALPVLVLACVNGDPESRLAGFLKEGCVVAIVEIWILSTGDVDADDATAPVRDRLLDEDRVQGLIERAIQTENEPGFHRIVEKGTIEAADRRIDDVVEVALPAAIPFHGVIAELESRNVRLAVSAADNLVDGLLDRQRARLNELGPVVERQEVFKGFLRLLADRDQIDEFPVVLGRQANPLVMRNSPHRRRIDGAAEMDVQLRQFIPKRVWHAREG